MNVKYKNKRTHSENSNTVYDGLKIRPKSTKNESRMTREEGRTNCVKVYDNMTE